MHPSEYLALHLPKAPKLSLRAKILLTITLITSLYLGGFALFIAGLPQPFTTRPVEVEAIAVFSGGAGRIETTLTELSSGFPGPILISGLNPSTTLADILSTTAQPVSLSAEQKDRIWLDTAQTTHENMASLVNWTRQNHLTHIAVITSTYHAARVRWLGRLLAKDLHLSILPVQPASTNLGLLFTEYNKLLAAPLLR